MTNLIPQFRIAKDSPGLLIRFLRELTITNEDIDFGAIVLEDGSEWRLYLEGDALIRYVEATFPAKIPCLCSFQCWEAKDSATEPEQIVVCRKLKPRAVAN